MTTTRYELKTSASSAEHWGARADQRVFIVEDTAAPATRTIEAAVCSSTGYGGISALPGHALFLSANTDGTGALSNANGNARVRTVGVRLIDEGSGHVEITIGLTEYAPFTDQTDPCRITTSTTLQTVPLYRTNPIVPTDVWTIDGTGPYYDADDGIWSGATTSTPPLNTSSGTVDADGAESSDYRPAGDIGGDKVDWNGNPIAAGLAVTRITVEVLRWGPYIDTSGNYTLDDQQLAEQVVGVGARNQATFCGFAQGEVLYVGCSRSPLDAEWYTARFEFLQHPYKHAVQVPRPTFGTSIGAMSYEGDPRSIRHYRGVYWQQPYLRGTDFNDLFTTDEQACLDALS